jgi:hypothetical protein
MRFGFLFLVLALASGGATLRAQGEPVSHLSFSPVQPLLRIRTYEFDSTSTATLYVARSGPTCPMPVAHTHSAKDDPMPVARGGTPEPMPVAKSGCWNPLDPAY